MEVDSSVTPSLDQVDQGNGDTNGVVTEKEDVVGGDDSPVVSGQISSGGGGTVSGPRHAPNYTVVNAILEKKEDGPGPRCGHTLTAVAAVGEEGTANYMGPRLILFGGATALEGNSANAGTPTSAGGAGIRMFSSPISSTRTL